MRAVNLIPTDQRRGASVGAGRSEGGAYVVLGLVAVIAALVFLYGHAKHQASDREGQISSLTSKVSTLKTEVTRLTPFTTFQQLREQRSQAVNSLVDSRFDWAHAFHELGRVLPSNVSISSLDGTIAAVAATTAAPEPAPAATATSSSTTSGTATTAAATTPEAAATAASSSSVSSTTPPGSVPTFTINGCAASQRAVANMLTRLRLIDGVSEVTLQSSTKSGAAGGGSGTGGCGAEQPSFAATITFDALPTTTEAAAATGTASPTTVADTGSSTAAGRSSSSTTTGSESLR